MDDLVLLGQMVSIGALAYGACLCFMHAGQFDVESVRRDVLASRAARTQGHVGTAGAISKLSVGVRQSMPAPIFPPPTREEFP